MLDSVGIALALSVLANCGVLPPDSPPVAPAPPDPDAPVFHDWKIAGHVLGDGALISELDAAGFDGRTVWVSPADYASPWSGRCDDPHRQHQPRTLGQLADQQQLPRDRIARLGLAEPITEFQLTCGPRDGSSRTPPLTAYVAGDRAVTCWSGVCYLLTR